MKSSDTGQCSPHPTVDQRQNVADESGQSFWVYDEARETIVAGPFGSKEYAVRVKRRTSWPWSESLKVGKTHVSAWRDA